MNGTRGSVARPAHKVRVAEVVHQSRRRSQGIGDHPVHQHIPRVRRWQRVGGRAVQRLLLLRTDHLPPGTGQLAARAFLRLAVAQHVAMPIQVPRPALLEPLQVVAPVRRGVSRAQEDALSRYPLDLRAGYSDAAVPGAVQEAHAHLDLRLEVDAPLRVVKHVDVLVHDASPSPLDHLLDAIQELLVPAGAAGRLLRADPVARDAHFPAFGSHGRVGIASVVVFILELAHHDGLRVAQQEPVCTPNVDEPVRLDLDGNGRRCIGTRRQQIRGHPVGRLAHEQGLKNHVRVATVCGAACRADDVSHHVLEDITAICDQAKQLRAHDLA
eukprot:scaffold876_cov243-Pinguiococcus_pyrenoidosus.AAC.30